MCAGRQLIKKTEALQHQCKVNEELRAEIERLQAQLATKEQALSARGEELELRQSENSLLKVGWISPTAQHVICASSCTPPHTHHHHRQQPGTSICSSRSYWRARVRVVALGLQRRPPFDRKPLARRHHSRVERYGEVEARQLTRGSTHVVRCRCR